VLIASLLALQMPIEPRPAIYCRNSLVSSLMPSMATVTILTRLLHDAEVRDRIVPAFRASLTPPLQTKRADAPSRPTKPIARTVDFAAA
jgi:hypothetical protein